MGFNKIWESVHAKRAWGHYPNEHLVRWVSNTFNEGRINTHFLDLGSGQGASTWFLAREGFKVTAVDGSRSAISKTQDWIGKEGLSFEGITCCITQLPFMDASFDAVVDVVSSAHNSEQDSHQIYAEIARVLKPKGKLFVVTPQETCSRRPFVGLGTVNYMNRSDLEWLLAKAFTDVKILGSEQQLADECFLRHWIATATRR